MSLPSYIVADILASLEAVRAGRPDDKRRASRLSVDAECTVIVGDSTEGTVAHIVDISPRGICLLYPTPLQGGGQFVIHLPREDAAPMPMLCTVVHCRRSDNIYRIGAEFTCVLNESKSPSSATSGAEAAEIERIRQSIFA